ncbi:hypothetical protein KIN20_025979 [Parelaphostrongylus tenuis]|uniref:Uncharacterized protein n=1 Tax=Parelaphostrongylus tenuis TaxID=148309 RepID=A0AAD5MW10_PARTN|nr:hypothetical protein KIN20_025979 [Parelaphostrongylus tenuis]
MTKSSTGGLTYAQILALMMRYDYVLFYADVDCSACFARKFIITCRTEDKSRSQNNGLCNDSRVMATDGEVEFPLSTCKGRLSWVLVFIP